MFRKSTYETVRLVLDVQSFYYIATEYLECPCGVRVAAWDQRLLETLPYATKCQFPACLTYKFALDKSLLTMLRSRSIGNSSTAIQKTINEVHSERYLRNAAMYLQDCKRYQEDSKFVIVDKNFEELPARKMVPTPKWFLSTYAHDVMYRAHMLKGSITSVFGNILKLDSTKKITKKLAGKARDSAEWCTNVGNEYGGILQCVMTASESIDDLKTMALGIMRRYKEANKPPPDVLYTDRDCCNSNGKSKFEELFSDKDMPEWIKMLIRLDIWHFMRRLAAGVTTESHPLYATFMSLLSGCIFKWNEQDYKKLMEAKRSELEIAGVAHPTNEAVKQAINKGELQRHCRRSTRGYYETIKLIEQLLLHFTGATDSLGTPLFNDQMISIWKVERRHVECIQDPPVTLYTQTGTLKKGNKMLPVYRCARGTTSLESFHSHIVNFIPGTSANEVNFQAYLLDGLARWNDARKEEAEKTNEATESNETSNKPMFRSFDAELCAKVDALHIDVLGKPLIMKLKPSAKINEYFGMEYLRKQNYDMDRVAKEVDNVIDLDSSGLTMGSYNSQDSIDFVCVNKEPVLEKTDQTNWSESEEESSEQDEPSEVCDWRGIPGWDKVDKLVELLVPTESSNLYIPSSHAKMIVKAFQKLDDYDKKAINWEKVKMKPASGRYKRRKRMSGHTAAREVATSRCFATDGCNAFPPSKTRIVEAIFIKLCNKRISSTTITEPGKKAKFASRLKLVLQDYISLRQSVFNTAVIKEQTSITLFPVNKKHLSTWFKDKKRREEVAQLMSGRAPPPGIGFTTTKKNMELNKFDLSHEAQLPSFEEPEDQIGKAKTRRKVRTTDKKKEETNTSSIKSPPTPYSPQETSQQTYQPQPVPLQYMTMPSQQFIQQLSVTHPIHQPYPSAQYIPIKPKPTDPNPYIPLKPASLSSIHPAGLGLPLPPSEGNPFGLPKTTHYRYLNQGKDPALAKQRKTYSCTKCHKAIVDDGHKRYYGYKYCPNDPNRLDFEEWQAKVKAAYFKKKEQKKKEQ